ncbi:hypothetical protein [Streptomyces canus]|uniref:hypothetical protein n=1 Tax=Streptomyces canus TaxID=58343 RepID=UPI00325517C6
MAGAAVGEQGAIEYSATGGPDGTLTAPEYSAETFVTVGSGPGFRIVNRSPAWVAHVASGGPVPAIDYYLPPGTTATSVPSTCPSASPSADAPAIPRLRVDQVVPDATGRVVVRPYDGSASFAFDPKTRNNSAKLVVNPSA